MIGSEPDGRLIFTALLFVGEAGGGDSSKRVRATLVGHALIKAVKRIWPFARSLFPILLAVGLRAVLHCL
jgi:hypothetical protein